MAVIEDVESLKVLSKHEFAATTPTLQRGYNLVMPGFRANENDQMQLRVYSVDDGDFRIDGIEIYVYDCTIEIDDPTISLRETYSHHQNSIL